MIKSAIYRKNRIYGGIALGTVLVLSLSLCIFSNIFAQNKPRIGADKAPITISEYAKAMNDALVNASEAVKPTVVSITVEIKSKSTKSQGGEVPEGMEGFGEDFFKFFGFPHGGSGGSEDYRSKGAGSGVFVSEDGYIVTNNHVVENADENGISVTTTEQKEYKAKLIGRDPLTDLAVIKIEGSNFPYVHFGDIEKVRVGEMVIAVGNPLGLNSTVTQGIVSAIGRGGLGLKKSASAIENFIQTDAAINPGNSGGGLFDLNGSLVGINTAIATQTGGYMGYGFAIPVDLVKSVVEDLITNGKISRGYIGVKITNVDEKFAKALGLDKVQGAVVNEVLKNSPAEKAGIEPEDVILEINGKPINGSNDLQSLIALHKAGEEVTITLLRDKQKTTKKVRLEARDDDKTSTLKGGDDEDENAKDTKEPIKFEKLGFSIEPLTSKQKEEMDVDAGVWVSNVKRYGPAAERNLFQGGVITKADRKPVKSCSQFKSLIDSKKSGDVVLLQVKYKERNQIIALEIP